MQKDDIKTIKFAAIICLVCSMALAGVKASLNSIQVRNKTIDGQINVLKALNPNFAPDGSDLSPEEQELYFLQGKVPKELIPGYFETYVNKLDVTMTDGTERVLYELKRGDEVVSYAFPAQGKGLWSTVHSYVGLESDMATIRGITFFDHGETPGLGGECSKPWFQKNFRGKKLMENGEPAKLIVAKGNADPETVHNVDGMSGATITGNGIQKFINKTFKEYNEAVFSEKRAM
jgi:Na+-transporting NADH:ubiquinone oxidoreductase subunit C